MSHLPLVLGFICGFVGSVASSLWWSNKRDQREKKLDEKVSEPIFVELPNTLDEERFPGEVFTDSNGIRSVYTGLGWATPSVNSDHYVELLQEIARKNYGGE